MALYGAHTIRAHSWLLQDIVTRLSHDRRILV
jgi:hypothetical protein